MSSKKLDEKLQTIFTELSVTLAPPEVHTIKQQQANTFFTAGGLSQLEFHRNFVSTSTPVLFKGGACHLPAFKKWTKKYLIEKTKGKELKVALTPQGRADALIDLKVVDDNDDNNGTTSTSIRAFLSPAETKMSSEEFFALLSEAKRKFKSRLLSQTKQGDEQDLVIPYQQAQNNCLLSDSTYHEIIPDLFDRPYAEQEKMKRERKERLNKFKSEEDKKREAEEEELLKDYKGPEGILSSAAANKEKKQEVKSEDHQNFTQESLSDQCSIVSFASEIFGTVPDASNIWIGGSLSTTSLHQDWYENFYIVIRGAKIFTLVPPTDCFAVPKVRVPEGKYVFDEKTRKFSVEFLDKKKKEDKNDDEEDGDEDEDEDEGFTWVDFDEEKTTENGGHVYTVEVQEGDVLYLPAMWQHQVQQRELSNDNINNDFVCAVNFWYDMQYGHGFFLQRLMKQCLGHPDAF